MKKDINDVKNDTNEMKNDISNMKNDISNMKNDISNMKNDIDNMKNDIDNMKNDINDLKQKVTKIDLTIENELRTNIMRVAEGHLDLSRNLHEAMKPNNEIEMLGIKVRMLEADVKELKQKIS